MLENIKWLGHAGFKISGEKTIYIDPWQLKREKEPADLILVTHEHFDHCSKEDIAKIRKNDTVIVTIAACAKELAGQIKTVKPGDMLTVQGIPIEVVSAYNVNKFRSPGVLYHPKEDAKVGFIVTVKGVRIYHAGDTDFIPEMRDIKTDVALLPVSGVYVMTAGEAVEAAAAINPKVAVPMHYGSIAGSAADAERFKRLSSVEVQILTPQG
ncbi:MAG: MBL fold metallo-hydrolase [Chloroflexi bacterium]|nr:MBL fold metallo-hydrolase [Chloroflexota bacterium]MCL5074683.1 MBL fold metallo-hydrolase [Chloroflexota bacterium]